MLNIHFQGQRRSSQPLDTLSKQESCDALRILLATGTVTNCFNRRIFPTSLWPQPLSYSEPHTRGRKEVFEVFSLYRKGLLKSWGFLEKRVTYIVGKFSFAMHLLLHLESWNILDIKPLTKTPSDLDLIWFSWRKRSLLREVIFVI